MRYFLRVSVGLLAGAALLVAGCGQAVSPPPKSTLHLSASPVRTGSNGEHIVVLTSTGQQIGKTYTLTPSGAPFHRLGVPSIGTREDGNWTVEYTEEGTAGRTRFVLSGPVPNASPPRSNTVVVKW